MSVTATQPDAAMSEPAPRAPSNALDLPRRERLAANWEAAHQTLAFGGSPLEIPAVSSSFQSLYRFVNSRESFLAGFLFFLFAAWICFAAYDTSRGVFVYLALSALFIGLFRTVTSYGEYKGLHAPQRRGKALGDAMLFLAAIPPLLVFLIRP